MPNGPDYWAPARAALPTFQAPRGGLTFKTLGFGAAVAPGGVYPEVCGLTGRLSFTMSEAVRRSSLRRLFPWWRKDRPWPCYGGCLRWHVSGPRGDRRFDGLAAVGEGPDGWLPLSQRPIGR
jgi:hypothetical protein